MREMLERAYAVGDHRTARDLAGRALGEHADDAALCARAREILAHTAPDPFLTWVGALGLGLTAWLVYNYMP